MKNLLYISRIVCLFSFLIFCSTCKKNSTPPTTLPPATQTGANTFGCKINGEVGVPYYPCPAYGNQCSEMQLTIFAASATSVLPLSISFGFGRN